MDFKAKVTELALQAGGSHYPSVNRSQMESYTRLVIAECISALTEGERGHICTNFDQGQYEATLAGAESAINRRFGL
jgi:hypothetical protein